MIKRIAPILLLLAFLPLPLLAQQTGASVTGHVIDPSGAAISGAKIKLISTQTGAVYPTESNSTGLYQLPFVLIGNYTLTVQKEGFKKFDQAGITLIGDQKAVIDVTLELGSVTQTVNVNANATVLQLESGDRIATIDNIKIDPEVLRGQNAIVATWFTQGVTVTAGDQKIRPWDNAGTQNESFNGGQDGVGGNLIAPGQPSGNQVMVDGISENRGGNGTGFNLMASAVDQIEVQATMYDAENGWSTGGYVNTLSKSGTNKWHGHGYDYLQNTWLNAEDWGQQHGGPGGTNSNRAPWHFNYFGGEIGGPLMKNKIFVFYGYQYMWSVQRDPFTDTIPTAAERQGNFQGVCGNSSGNCTQAQLYDPATLVDQSTATNDPTGCYYTTAGPPAVASGANPCRSQLGPNFSAVNVINPAVINPIAKNVLNIIPLPTIPGTVLPCGGVVSGQTGVVAGLCGQFANNITNSSTSRKFIDQFPEHTGRIDWNFNEKTHAFFRFSKNDLAETRSYVYSTVSSINAAESSGNNPLFRGNQAYALQVTHTINPTTVLEMRTGMDRYPNGGGDRTIANTDPGSLGFSATWGGLVGHFFPQITFGTPGYNQDGGTLPSYTASDVWNHAVILAHTRGKHNLRFGWQRFDLADYSEGPGTINGAFAFSGGFTSANQINSTTLGPTGNSNADFLLGLPNTVSINQPTYPEWWQHEESLFTQDDWHISRKLTLNLGIRWDYAGPVHEKWNRLLNGFCFTCASPLGTVAPYVNSLGTTVSGPALLGGPTFAGTNGSPNGVTNPKYDNFGPRIGFAYDMGHDMVLRGGYGVIYGQQILETGPAPGFSAATSAITQPVFPGIFNPAISFANPIQTGLVPIVGSAYGLATNMGSGITFIDPNVDIPRTTQVSLEVQKRFGKDWLVSVAFVGTKTNRLIVNQNLNYVPLADEPYTPNFTTNTTAPAGGGAATNSFLSANVKGVGGVTPYNPFSVPTQYLGATKGTYLQAANVGQSQLLYQFPQFSQVTENDIPIGRSHYSSLQFEVSHRLAAGLEFTADFYWAKTLQSTVFINPQDPFPRQNDSPLDFPRQFKLNFVYFAPFGRGQKFLNHTNGLVNAWVSGWSLSATPMLEDGPPAPVPAGLMPIKGVSEATTPAKNLLHWFNTCYVNTAGVNVDCGFDSTPAWKQMVPGQLIEWSYTIHQVRYPGVHDLQLGIMKKWPIKERYTITYRADFINALNSAQFFQDLDTTYTSGTFGEAGYPKYTPSDDPRVIQMSLQFSF
ncbi:MAG: carboxypeptidase-like regulatory domain-containing protein [Terriglobia bacterium]